MPLLCIPCLQAYLPLALSKPAQVTPAAAADPAAADPAVRNDPFTAPRRRSRAGREDDYKRVLGLSWLFYEGQMSGNLPRWNRLLASKPGGYKKSAHLKDGSDIGKDLSGGFYDAGGVGTGSS